MVIRIACILLLLEVAACSAPRSQPQPGPVAVAPPPPPPCAQIGRASWYRPGLHRSADGDHHGASSLIAAHRTLPLGTRVRVTDVESGRSVTVRIDDRGPFVHGRIIDLSPAAAKRLGMWHDGVSTVRVEVPTAELTGSCPLRASSAT